MQSSTCLPYKDPIIKLKFRDKTYVYNDKSGLRELYNNQPTYSKKTQLYCQNCNKQGHIYKNCRFPINSYGEIIYKKSSDNHIRYLLIQRKYTPIYVELLRAKYYYEEILNFKYLITLISNLPYTERYYILTYEFDYLWSNLWRWVGTQDQLQCIYDEYGDCKGKFNRLKNGFVTQSEGWEISFGKLFNDYPYTKIEPEWEFPKGKRDFKETDIECAIRETEEETTLCSDDYKLLLHVKPFQEKFTGINQIKYCNSYYLAQLLNFDRGIYYDPDNIEQNKEIRKIGWFTANEIRNLILSNQKQKFSMFNSVNRLVNNLCTK